MSERSSSRRYRRRLPLRQKKPLSDEEKAALKAAAWRLPRKLQKRLRAARGRGKTAAAAKPKHEEDPNKPVWEKDPVAPEWQDGSSDPLTVAIKEEFGDAIESARSFAGDLAFQVRRDAIAQVAASLKDRHKFTYLIDICGADYPNGSRVSTWSTTCTASRPTGASA